MPNAAEQTRQQAEILITREKARLDYLAMGSDRSLAKLHQNYANSGLNPPSLSSLKAWSGQEGWQGMTAAYDEQVAQKVRVELVQRVAENEVETVLNAQDRLSHCVELGITKALQSLEQFQPSSLGDGHRALKLATDALMLKEQLGQSIYRRELPSMAQTGEQAASEVSEVLATILEKGNFK
jgi:hypothetical protein